MTSAEFSNGCTFGFIVSSKGAIGVNLDNGGGCPEKTVSVFGGVSGAPHLAPFAPPIILSIAARYS
ncbi:hypothetical protein [Xenorhabdus doucetiae]|uniref:hypothetical protein n=1 Tax=Xenorhabdus doucetiae TaxID=351671 RepID=UPI0011E6C7E7|nr:hypothetical protein [Xenorhabdus doucetiae]